MPPRLDSAVLSAACRANKLIFVLRHRGVLGSACSPPARRNAAVGLPQTGLLPRFRRDFLPSGHVPGSLRSCHAIAEAPDGDRDDACAGEILKVLKSVSSDPDNLGTALRQFAHEMDEDLVLKVRDHGGLGVRDLNLQNSCLLLKLIHRLHTSTDSSWASWARERVDLASMRGAIDGTHWTMLRELLPLYQALTTVEIGDGKSTSFWNDSWLGDVSLAEKFPALCSHSTDLGASVHCVLSEGVRGNLVPRLTRAAVQDLSELGELLQHIRLSSIPDRRHNDALAADGHLRTALVYEWASAASAPDCDFHKYVWGDRTPPKVQFFAWLLARDIIQSKYNLHTKNIVDNTACELCTVAVEDADHLLFACPTAKEFWRRLRVDTRSASSRCPWEIRWPSQVPDKYQTMLTLLCCWEIWKHRNGVHFRHESPSLQRLTQCCIATARDWRCRLPREDATIVQTWCAMFLGI